MTCNADSADKFRKLLLLASTTGSENVLAYKADPVGMRSPCKVSCLGPIDSIRLAGTQRHGANIVRGATACLFMCLLDISRPTVDATSPDRCEAKNIRQVNKDEPDINQDKHGYHTLRRPRSDMFLRYHCRFGLPQDLLCFRFLTFIRQIWIPMQHRRSLK
jgi:hypothetical protein